MVTRVAIFGQVYYKVKKKLDFKSNMSIIFKI